MSLYQVSILSAFSIVIPFISVVSRFKRMRGKYLPLAVLLSIGFLNEAFSLITEYRGHFNSVNGNIYVLFDFVLTVWLFYHLASGLSKKFFVAVVIAGSIVWIADNFLVHSLYSNNSLFRMVASFLIVFLSIDKINQIIFSSGYIETNRTDLVLSAGFLVYFTYKAFVEAYHVFPMHPDKSFYIILWVILGIINMIVNLMFAIAILCISQKTLTSIRL